MLFVYGCDTQGTTHEWVAETVRFQDNDPDYGPGHMRQRRCLKCGNAEYIKFVSLDSKKVVDIDGPLIEAGIRDRNLPK